MPGRLCHIAGEQRNKRVCLQAQTQVQIMYETAQNLDKGCLISHEISNLISIKLSGTQHAFIVHASLIQLCAEQTVTRVFIRNSYKRCKWVLIGPMHRNHHRNSESPAMNLLYAFVSACVLVGTYMLWKYLSCARLADAIPPTSGFAKTVMDQPVVHGTIQDSSSIRQAPCRFSDPTVCRKILKGETYDESLGPNLLSFSESRGLPNQRLVRAFEINNGFTTFENDGRVEFRGEAERKINTATEYGWKSIAIDALDLASEYFEKYEFQSEGQLDLIVQIVTLKVVLHLFWGVQGGKLSKTIEVVRVAQDINKLWILSKTGKSGQAQELEALKGNLKKLGLEETSPQGYPLNILLPVYETLWRVVARCLIEIVFRPSANPEWLRILRDFRADPSRETFRALKPIPGQQDVSASFLVKEALRLYPPTRRVYRQYKFAGKEEQEVVAADIEACHRLPTIWGDASHKYQPTRWARIDKGMQQAFMPFGGTPYICPAESNFGPMMIGILVAALASCISKSKWELRLVREGYGLLDGDMELNSDRSQRTDWMIYKKNK